MALAEQFDSEVIDVPSVSAPAGMNKRSSAFLDDLIKFAGTRMPLGQRFKEGMTKAAEVIHALEIENHGLLQKNASYENYFKFEKFAWELVDQGLFGAEAVREKVAAWAKSGQSPEAIRDQYAYGLHEMPEMGKDAELPAETPATTLAGARQDLGNFLESLA